MGATKSPTNPRSPMNRRKQRQLEAADRATIAAALSVEEQIECLNARPGAAVKERSRLERVMETVARQNITEKQAKPVERGVREVTKWKQNKP